MMMMTFSKERLALYKPVKDVSFECATHYTLNIFVHASLERSIALKCYLGTTEKRKKNVLNLIAALYALHKSKLVAVANQYTFFTNKSKKKNDCLWKKETAATAAM